MSAPPLSVVIPTLEAAEALPATLAALAEARVAGLLAEIVVADGGSVDGTLERARAAGATVIAAPRGRGPQLRAGAAAAGGEWLLFLHADSRPAPGWAAEVVGFVRAPENAERAAVFRLRFEETAPGARRVAGLANWRSRVLGLPYGDQGLLISRAFYDTLGGYRPLVLMEDVEIVRRIGRRRLVHLPVEIITSGRRYRSGGWWGRSIRNLALLAGYFLGVPPRLLARCYR